jgi:hypothetical protein
MVRNAVRLFSRLTLACPICAAPEGAQMTIGVPPGALVLVVVTLAVLGTLAAFAVRLWRAERTQP